MDEIINKVVLKLEGKMSNDDIRNVRDAMQIVLAGYKVEALTTEIAPYTYQLPDCYKMFMASKVMDGRMSERSKEQYRLCLEKMLYRLQLPVEQITSNHLRAYILEISQKPNGKRLAAATLNQRKSIIRSFFAWLTEEEYITKNPALRLHQEKVNRRPEPVFTDIQIETIRDGCGNIRDEAIINLLTSSGIRITECVELKKDDIDLDERSAIVFGKGGKYRTVYFDARTEFALRQYLASRDDDSEYLFVSVRKPHGKIKPNAVRCRMSRISDSTGISKIHPHRFRHTLATGLAEKGMPLPEVQQILGHTKIDTTMRYTHVSTSKVKQAYERYA